jgi:starvation-inducible DNA-binding protein
MAQGNGRTSRKVTFLPAGLDRKASEQLVGILQARLVSLIDLGLTLKHIHWNVVGPHFIGVHEMLDPQIDGVRAMVDVLAERMSTLGVPPNGLVGALVQARSWDDYELTRADTTAHLAALDLVYTGVIEDHRAAIDKVGDDPVTEDILIGQTGELEQYQWFIRAHLQGTDGELVTDGATDEITAAKRAVGARAGVKKAPAKKAARKR